ncbi:hypothetical protein SAMN02745163_00087 [Clostridium cavendishii DSM 21758]|uniref:Uncharacterized protein n=1 Tax=Clostridium cavendishii DSM 21758 TaxID=1121302 RepID=A0A1M6AHV9_9CLOT|nr:hypothetical protein [Clostridium cavendishii]SHI36017.1 hypothetical protein SAMN02745163_00087 [Clostridium cavendishii DSM 21758]
MAEFTVNDILQNVDVGCVIPLIVEVKDEELPIIFIKDYESNLHNIEDECIVGIKSSNIENKDIMLYLLMLKFGEDYEAIYDIWFNYGLEGHREFLNTIKYKDRILIDFRSEDNERIKTIEIQNTIKGDLQKYIDNSEDEIIAKEGKVSNVITLGKIKKYKSWDENKMNDLIDKVCGDYDSIEDLWLNL